MLLKLILNKGIYHGPIYFLNNHFGQPCRSRFFANPINNLLHAFWRAYG